MDMNSSSTHHTLSMKCLNHTIHLIQSPSHTLNNTFMQQGEGMVEERERGVSFLF